MFRTVQTPNPSGIWQNTLWPYYHITTQWELLLTQTLNDSSTVNWRRSAVLLNIAVRPAKISIRNKKETPPTLFHVCAKNAGIRSQHKENTVRPARVRKRNERGKIPLPFPKIIPHFNFPRKPANSQEAVPERIAHGLCPSHFPSCHWPSTGLPRESVERDR